MEEDNHKKQHDLRVLAATLITTEQGLINNRMTWMMTFQGLLFASFALTASEANDREIKTIIIETIPYVGLFVALITLSGIIAAFLSITHIKNSLDEKIKKIGFDLEDGLIPYGTKSASFLGRGTAYLFPIIIASTWITIAIRVHKININKVERVNNLERKSMNNNIINKSIKSNFSNNYLKNK